VAYSIIIHTGFFGDIKQDNAMTLVQEDVPQPTPEEGGEPETKMSGASSGRLPGLRRTR
jgi:hypothetical protein